MLFNERDLKSFVLEQGKIDFKFYLRKPNMDVIQEIDFLENIQLNNKLGGINELTFTLPFYNYSTSEGTHINPMVDLLKPHYLIEMDNGHWKDLFLILKEDKKIDEKENTVSFKLLSYPRQLSKDIIFEYEATSKTLSEIAEELLENSSWEVGYVEAIFEKGRSFELKQQTLLEGLIQLAQKFNALIQWHPFSKTVDFMLPTRVGTNRGLVIEEEKYLKKMDLTIDSEEIITQLHAYGKDNITISKLTPTGAPYLEDFSWFMYPFQMEDGKVIQSSDYMSDDLCIAILDYQEVLKENEGKFDELLDERIETEERRFKAWKEQSDAEMKLMEVTDRLDVLNSMGEPEEVLAPVIEEKKKHEAIVENLVAKVEEIDAELEHIDKRLEELYSRVKKENNFTYEQLRELDNFTISKVWQESSIEDEEDLLEEALEVFETFKKPKVKANVDIENFLEILEYYGDWDKLQLGDTIRLYNEDMNIDVFVQILGLNYNISESTITLELANERDNGEASDDFLKELYGSMQSSTTVNMDRYKWDMAEDARDGVSKILNNAWDAAKQQIEGGHSQSVTISERGLIIRSTESPHKLLIAQNGILGLSRDGGNTWKTAITPEGIVAERLTGRVIMSNRLFIEDEDGIIKFTGSLQTVYDKQDQERVQIGKYVGDDGEEKYGMRIDSGALEIIGGLNEDHLSPEIIEGIEFDDSQIREDLRLTSPLPTNITLNRDGITAYTKSNDRKFARMDYRGLYVQGGALDIRTREGDEEGIHISGEGISGFSTMGQRTFYINNYGELFAMQGSFGGSLQAASGTFAGELSAASGTFAGTLRAADGVFTGRLNGNHIVGAKIQGSEIIGGSLQIGDNFFVDRFGNLTAKKGTFSGNISTLLNAEVGKLLKLNAQADDGGIVLNHKEIRNGRIYFTNKEIEGQSLARLILEGRIVRLQGLEGGTELASANGKTVITSMGARKPHLEFWTQNQSSYHGQLQIDGNNGFRLATANGMQIILANRDYDGVSIMTSGGGYGDIYAKEFMNKSDRALKEDIEEFECNALDKICSTPVYSYNMKGDKRDKKSVGLIYQESPDDIVNDNGKSIELYAMSSMLWKGVQELNKENEDLNKRVDQLEKLVASLLKEK